MKRKTISITIFIALFLALSAQAPRAAETMNLALHLRIGELRRAVEPEIVGHDILFSYWAPHKVRFVGIAFGKEDYTVIHPFFINPQGVFVYSLPRNATDSVIEYRLVVDGLWMNDPANPEFRMDEYGQKISLLKVTPLSDRYDQTPRFQKDGKVTFIYYGPPGRMVSIAGSFNSWDPFMHILTETSPGTYSVTLTLPPGEYLYCFVSDGMKITDPQNPVRSFLPGGTAVSAFSVAMAN